MTSRAAYDDVASVYDGLFRDPQSIRENEFVTGLFSVRPPLLDIGCGTGLLLDYKHLDPAEYVGVDPSAKMLDRLKARHPRFAGSVHNLPLEDFSLSGRRFGSIVALFGAASYVAPETLIRALQRLAPGGTAFLMYYAPDYWPVTHKQTGIAPVMYPPPPGGRLILDRFIVHTARAPSDD